MKWINDIKRLKTELHKIESKLKFDSIKNGKTLELSVNENIIKIVKLYGPNTTKLEIINLDFEEQDEIADFVSQCLEEDKIKLTEKERNRIICLNKEGWNYATMAFEITERRHLDI